MRKAVSLRYRDYVRESVSEYQRRGNFVRIYPAKGSDIYDQYFASARPYNKLVYKVLFTDEILKCIQYKPTTDARLGYKMDIPPTSYEQYKSKVVYERQVSKDNTKEEQK